MSDEKQDQKTPEPAPSEPQTQDPSRDVVAAGSTIEPRPGGKVFVKYPGGVEASGEVLEIHPPDRIVFHGNNKSDAELRGAAEAEATVVLDASDEPGRAAAAGVRRALVRLTPGVDAVTHESIQTAHEGSKFGLAADPALAVIDEARGLGIDVVGVHFHVGSQLAQVDESLVAVERLAAFCERARAELGWTPTVLDIGGGLGIRYTRDEQVPEIEDFVGPLVQQLR